MALAEINWLEFRAYSWQHAAAVAWCWALIVGAVALGHTFKKRGELSRELHVRRSLALVGVVFWVAYSAWWNWNVVDWREGMPLQLCDVAGLIGPIALLTASRWLRATLYFWGLTLSMQGFLQPVLRAGPADVEYWGFWLAHTIIVGSALYDVVVGTAKGRGEPVRFRPMLSDLGRAVASSFLYLGLVMPLNVARGFNYGYVGNSPIEETPKLITHLGPWPWRVVVMVAMAISLFVLAWLPWAWAERRRTKRPLPDKLPRC